MRKLIKCKKYKTRGYMLNVFKRMRLEAGKSQMEAARLIGVTNQTIYRWENLKDVTKWNQKQFIYLFALSVVRERKELMRKYDANPTIAAAADFLQLHVEDFLFNLANKKYDYV
jgi:DNA-binding XRE family transcriptional regulator